MTATHAEGVLVATMDSSFADYVADSGPRLKRMAYLLTGNFNEAEDLLQSAYAKAMPHWSRIRDYESPDAYVRRIMINQRRSWWRLRTNREVPVADFPAAQTPDSSDGVINHLTLLTALKTLSPGQRRAVVLRHYSGLTEEETADAMGCSIGNVKSKTSRGLLKLRQALNAVDNDKDSK